MNRYPTLLDADPNKWCEGCTGASLGALQSCPVAYRSHRTADGSWKCNLHGIPTNQRAVVLFDMNDLGEILAITRGHHGACMNDWGLVGGKVDPGEIDADAVVREVFEEALLKLFTPIPIYAAQVGHFWATTFVGKLEGVIKDSEEGHVEYIKPFRLLQGTFAEYNHNLFRRLGIL
jgi:hypothetical protein